MPTVYMAGPISGESWDGATSWRDKAKEELERHGIHAFSPLRAKKYLEGLDGIDHAYPDYPLSTEKGLTTRDRFDCQRVDVVLVNLTEAKRVSIGTMIELGWADSKRIPVVLAMQEDNIHNHPIVRQCAGFIVGTIEEAVHITTAILLP